MGPSSLKTKGFVFGGQDVAGRSNDPEWQPSAEEAAREAAGEAEEGVEKSSDDSSSGDDDEVVLLPEDTSTLDPEGRDLSL